MVSLVISTPASADLRCSLVSSVASASTQQGPDFVFLHSAGRSEVVWLSSFGTLVLQCYEAIFDEYECYGFGPLPFKTPVQLNITDFNIGSTVILTALNQFFLPHYNEREDVLTRRFAIDHYEISGCQ